MYIKHKNVPTRRLRVMHLCKIYHCDLETLKRDHSDLLSAGVRCQLTYMIYLERHPELKKQEADHGNEETQD